MGGRGPPNDRPSRGRRGARDPRRPSDERERLLAWTNDPAGPAVVFVHGAGGIGKTTLVSGSFDPARAVMLGAGEVEPTPARLLAHLGRLVGVSGEATPESIGTAMTTKATLSPRECEVISALADGLTNQELSERLFISERTANRDISNIFTKLGVHNRTAAARVAIEAGLTA